PVGVPVDGPAAVTVAVKVTGWPKTAARVEDDRPVFELAGLMTCVRIDDVLPVKLLLPTNSAVRLWLPSGRFEITKLALPAGSSVAVPRVAAPSCRLTGPAGMPALEVTLTLKVTG